MKFIFLSLILFGTIVNVKAQHEPHVAEPPVINVDGHLPEKNQNEGNSGKDLGKSGEGKPGKNNVSQSVKDAIANIKNANSIDGQGTITTEVQRTEVLRQLENERIKAESEGRRSDVKYLEKEMKKIKKIKLVGETKKPKNDKKTSSKDKDHGGAMNGGYR